MVKQQYEEYNSENFSCSSSKLGMDSDNNKYTLYNENNRAIYNELNKLEEEIEDLTTTYEADPKSYKHLRAWFGHCNINKKIAAAEMLCIVPLQRIGPAAQKHIIEEPNNFFDVNQQKYVQYETETKKKGNENETKKNDTRNNNNDGNNGADMVSTAIDEQERIRILRDIKAIIECNTDESSETETIFLNKTNNTVPITDKLFETNESINDTKTEASEV